ncbi:MAG: hypothetical protein HBSIN02_17560 [Bacteroidia bacterium]|nr:MAG: hypothetical protein HBSIN02_17560 [Bacteroidia bacterium]
MSFTVRFFTFLLIIPLLIVRAQNGGSLSYRGDRFRWYEDAFHQFPSRYPAVKSLIFFHATGDATVTPQALDWTVTHDSVLTKTISRQISLW